MIHICTSSSRVIFAVLSVALASIPALQARTFKSPDGRTLEADIQGATVDMVTLKLANGQTLAAPINKFSQEDQAFIADWRKQNPQQIKYDFLANFAKDKKDSSKSRSLNTTITTETWVCNMKITNRSGQTLEGAKVKYDIYYNESDGQQMVLRKKSGSTDMPTIKHLQELVVPTEEFQIKISQLDAGWYYADGSKSRQRDGFAGIALTIVHDGKDVFNWASGGVPKDRTTTADGSKGSLFDR